MLGEKVKVLVVDDHALVREMVATTLRSDSDEWFVETESNAGDAVKTAVKFKPDVVLMDIDMPGMICFDAAERILSLVPAAKVIFVSAHVQDHYIEQALRIGASGYVTKTSQPGYLLGAIRQVVRGRVSFSPEVRARIVADRDGLKLGQKQARTLTSTLTTREREVLQYVAKGLSKKNIAKTMHLSVKTVESHTGRLMAKLNLHDRVGLTRFAIREGLVEL